MSFIHSLVIASLLIFHTAANAQHCRSKKTLTAAQQIATLDPSFDLDLVDLDLFPGSSIVAGYEYEVEPAYTNGLYSRTDSWQIGFKAIPGMDLGGSLDTRLSAGVRTRTEATFIRFFKDPCEAMLSKPYSPRRIPLTAHRALSPKFEIGDYFLFRGSMGFVAGADIFQMLGSSFWGVSFSGSYLIEGNYQVHIVRIDDKHIRLKVIAHRGRGFNASVGLGYENEFNVFSIERLNDRLERFVNTKPVKLTANLGHAKVFMVDYVLDLTDPEVVAAYEDLLPKAKDFRNLDLIKEFEKGIDSDLLLDLSALEEIYRRDYQNGNVARLQRNLRSSSDQDAFGFGLEVGNKVVGFEIKRGTSNANMSIPQANDAVDRFMLKSWEKKSESRFFYSWLRTKNNEGLRALFKADKDFKEFEPLNIVKFINNKKNRFSYNNFLQLKKRLKKSLPDEIYSQIPWENWTQRRGKKFNNYGLRYELLMAPETIINAPELSAKEIKVLFKDHILSKGLRSDDYFIGSATGHNTQNSPDKDFDDSLNSLARTLSRALDKGRPSVERVELISKLRRNKLFADSGLSFLMALFPDKMRSFCHFDLNISSNEANIDFSYGDDSLSALYKKILTIKAALDDDGIDLIREAESLSSL